MARPTKWRKIEHVPAIAFFVPAEGGVEQVAENVLKLEELEAVRLKDLEGLEQGECADRMAVSRPTFQRILLSAREKIADSLVNGKTIHIEGGNFTKNICPVRCLDCGNVWSESFENLKAISDGNLTCPVCASKKITCEHSCRGRLGRGNCWRYSGQNH